MTAGRRHANLIAASTLLAMLAPGLSGPAAAEDPALAGRWSAPFAEPTIRGVPTDDACVEDGGDPAADQHDGKHVSCKPTATSLAVLGDQDVVYWDGLEDTEEVEASIVLEFGEVTSHDQVRRLDLATRTWTPSNSDIDPDGTPPSALLPGSASTETYNDDVLFCASMAFTPDGRVLAVGGTTYYQEPDLPSKYGVVELEGSRKTRVYDPETNTWSLLGDMTWGRWYPTIVTLPDGRHDFVAGGVSKLMKPLYPDRDPTDSGRNVPQTETLDLATGQWTENPDSADKSLPLYPRLHLLPNGQVYYNAAGQVYNPQGQAYDELLWNVASAYDPTNQTWTDLGIPGLNTAAPGFRGSTTSLMLPLRPDADGRYTSASFLTAGGILGVTPGTYFAVTDARIDTVDTTTMTLTSASTGALNQPRWYGQSVLLPTGEVFVTNGASADEVAGPGTGMPVMTPEIYDPTTGTWTQMATAAEARTYHNTAALLPDGRILVGGHDPISTLYGFNTTLVPGVTTPNETRNPTFEIYEPPYLFRGDRPVISKAPSAIAQGGTFKIRLEGDADDISEVVLMRRTAITHLVDGAQRSIELPILARHGRTLTLQAPPDGAVAPAGGYMLFVNRATADGPVPSEGTLIQVTGSTVPAAAVAASAQGTARAVAAAEVSGALSQIDHEAAGGVAVDADLAYHEASELTGHERVQPAVADAALTRAPAAPAERSPWIWLVAAIVAVPAAQGIRRRWGAAGTR